MEQITVPPVPGILNEPLTVDVEMISAGHYRVYEGPKFLGVIRQMPVPSRRRWKVEPLEGSPCPILMRTRDDAICVLVC